MVVRRVMAGADMRAVRRDLVEADMRAVRRDPVEADTLVVRRVTPAVSSVVDRGTATVPAAAVGVPDRDNDLPPAFDSLTLAQATKGGSHRVAARIFRLNAEATGFSWGRRAAEGRARSTRRAPPR